MDAEKSSGQEPNILERLLKVSKDSWIIDTVSKQNKIILAILVGLSIGLGGTCLYFLVFI